MIIRLEDKNDYRAVEELTREAFWNVYRPGCVEHYVLNRYRDDPDFVRELDFVMEEEGRIIGHVMYSKASLKTDDGRTIPAWTFGPISIHPDYKRKGYGLRLMEYSLEKAKEMGVALVCLEGNIGFYGHAGFVVASTLGIHYHGEPKESEVPYFLAQELVPGCLNGVEATYHTPKGYLVADENPEAFAAYDATFEAKVKHLEVGQLPQFCQSCGMPLTQDGDCGKEADGTINFDYCKYCYQDGAFLQEYTMEQMIEHCAQFVDEVNKNTGQQMTEDQYKEMMRGFFPMLKRWSGKSGVGVESELKSSLMAEINALGIKDMPAITDLFLLQGSYVNMEYEMGGRKVKLLDDDKTYLGNQVEKVSEPGRCFGIACDERYILVCEYGGNGADPEIVMLKRR